MALRDVIANELRALRKQPGPLDEAKMLSAPAIVKGLGGDRPDVALNRMLLLVRRNRDDQDILAAIASMGALGNDRESVQDRLSDYALRDGTDARTVRRRSDRGIVKLAAMILTESPWIDPRVFLALRLDEEGIEVRVQFDAPKSIGMRLPTLTIDDEDVELTFGKVSDYGHKVVYQTDSMRIPMKQVAGQRMMFQLGCRGEIPPTYVADAWIVAGSWSVRTHNRLFGLGALVQWKPYAPVGVAAT